MGTVVARKDEFARRCGAGESVRGVAGHGGDRGEAFAGTELGGSRPLTGGEEQSGDHTEEHLYRQQTAGGRDFAAAIKKESRR